jgi:hypothetical protein
VCVESMLRVRWECVGVGALYHVVDAYQVAFAHGTTDVQGFFFFFPWTSAVTEGLKFFFWGRISRVHVGQDRACVDLFVFNDTIYLSRCDGGTMLGGGGDLFGFIRIQRYYLFVFNDTMEEER